MTTAKHRFHGQLPDPRLRERAVWPVASFAAQVRVLAARSLRTAFSDRRLVFFGLLQPIVLLLLFSQVFGGVGALPSVAVYDGYINFLVPSTLVNIALITAMSSGAGVLAEIYSGFTARLRCLPVNLLAFLTARTVADAVRLAVLLTVTVLASIAILGFRPAGGVLGVVAALLLTVLVGWCLSWVFLAITTWLRKPEVLQAVSFIVMFPLMFSSSAYMPLAAMPAWLRVISMGNPVTYATDAARALALGRSPGASILAAIGIAAAAGVVGVAVASRTFRADTS